MTQTDARRAISEVGFHHRWCNSKTHVNTTLQGSRFVLVSDPFTKDSAHSDVPDSEQQSRCKSQAIQPGNLSAEA
jgi:hypothetical protein